VAADKELAMEGMARDGEAIFIAGSHSMHRKTVDAERTYKKNKSRRLELQPHERSYSLVKITLDEDGQLSSREKVSLRDILKSDGILGPSPARRTVGGGTGHTAERRCTPFLGDAARHMLKGDADRRRIRDGLVDVNQLDGGGPLPPGNLPSIKVPGQ
jgi:hypothetical protein